MSRLIDADALHREFIDFIRASNNKTPNWNDAVSLVGSAPTVDAVQVVRCKDCEYYGEDGDSVMDGIYKRCSICGKWHTGSWYCASGERREEDDLLTSANHDGERKNDESEN